MNHSDTAQCTDGRSLIVQRRVAAMLTPLQTRPPDQPVSIWPGWRAEQHNNYYGHYGGGRLSLSLTAQSTSQENWFYLIIESLRAWSKLQVFSFMEIFKYILVLNKTKYQLYILL